MTMFKAAPVTTGIWKTEWGRPGPLPIPQVGVRVMPTESYRLRVGKWRCPKGKSEAEGLRKDVKYRNHQVARWGFGSSSNKDKRCEGKQSRVMGTRKRKYF